MNHAQFWGGGGAAPYEIEQSLRFDGSSTKLSRTPSSTGSAGTLTISYWAKHVTGQSGQVLESWLDANNWSATAFASDVIGCQVRAGGTYTGRASNTVTQKSRDPSAWYHVVWSQTGGTQNVYINGVLASTFTSVGTTSFNTSGRPNTIGARSINSEYFAGYLAEMHLLDGTAAGDPDGVFGEFDDNGVWRPIEYTGGNYGTNGFYMKFDPSATNGVGHDHSGNGNNFTATGFTTSGTGTDVMSDTPTNNYATLNPLNTNDSNYTYSNGNLDLSAGSAWQTTTATFYTSSGKWYYEYTAGAATAHVIGIAAYPYATNNVGIDATAYGYQEDGRKWNNSSASSYGATYTNGDVIGVAYNLDDNEITFYKNGVSQGVAFTGITSLPVSPAISLYNGSGSVNFGQRAFAYTPPTGFSALNTSNLPAPDIADGSQYFNTVLYTGNSTDNHSITGVGFQPDWTWVKARSDVRTHSLVDAVRGAGKILSSNNTNAEYTDTTAFASFDADGFTVGTTENYINNSSHTYVAWNWLAGGSGSSNTAGTITSTVSANPTAGFSIVSYSGNNNSSATVGHGLGVSPDLVIVKDRSTSNYVWMVKFATLGGDILELNGTTSALATNSYSTGTIGTLTSTTFGFTTNNSLQAVNNTGQNYIAYCFAEVEGYSKIGSYEGNGSSDGPFVYCGFRPAWLLVKRTDASNWFWAISDSARSPYNPDTAKLFPNNSNVEDTSSYPIDFTSNGIKFRTNQGTWNASSGTYIFMALAENPFGGSGVSPAPAR